MVSEEIYSEELKEVLKFLDERIIVEHPTTTLTVPYIILSILNVPTTKAISVFERITTTASLDMICMSMLDDIRKTELFSMRPNKQYQMHPFVNRLFDSAENERKKLNEDKLCTTHIILAVLSGAAGENIKKVFESVGIDYQTFLAKMLDNNRNTQQKSMENMIRDVFNLPQNAKIEMFGNFPGMQGSFGMFPNQPTQNNKKNSTLSQFCTNLNLLAKEGKIDKVIGRELEMAKIIRVLGRRKKNNVLLLGDGGVGKTAIVNGIAQMIVDGTAPISLSKKEIYSLDMTAIIAGTQFRGMLEERFKLLISELKGNKNIILFIDDIHQIVNSGKNDMDISEIVNKAMSDGDAQIIGCTTYKMYKKTIEDNSSLDRKFQKISIDPETIENSIVILNELKGYYEKFHHVKYDDDAIKNCVILADKYIPERLLPDSAIDIIDEAGAYSSSMLKESDEIKLLRKEIKSVEEDKKKNIANDNINAVHDNDAKLNELHVKLITAEKEFKKTHECTEISSDDIYRIVSEKTGIPISKLSTDEKKSLAHIDDEIKKIVIGQDDAVDTICRAIKRSRVGLSNKNKPVSVIAIGSTGIGKCVSGNTKIKIRNKKTFEIQELTILEFRNLILNSTIPNK